MTAYEHVFILRQDLTSQAVDQLVETLKGVVAGQQGQVASHEYWGLRSLAYRIKKNRKGHYVLLNIEAPPAAVLELERQQKINEDVIRYMTVRVEALSEGPSAMMRSKDRDRERGFGDDRGFGDRGFDRGYDRGDRGDRGYDRGERGERGAERGERGQGG